jgi:hypothetical protein
MQRQRASQWCVDLAEAVGNYLSTSPGMLLGFDRQSCGNSVVNLDEGTGAEIPAGALGNGERRDGHFSSEPTVAAGPAHPLTDDRAMGIGGISPGLQDAKVSAVALGALHQ